MNKLDGTCRVVMFSAADLILPPYDRDWNYVLRGYENSCFSQNGQSLFAPNRFKWDPSICGKIVYISWSAVLNPDLLGNYGWGGNGALVSEVQDLVTNEHYFHFSVGVPDPDGMIRPDYVVNRAVVRGTGRYADFACRYYPDTRQWVYEEILVDHNPVARLSLLERVCNPDLDGCQFPARAKARASQVQLPKLESWIGSMYARKAQGESIPTGLTQWPNGFPLKWEHWSAYMARTSVLCGACLEQVGIQKAQAAVGTVKPSRGLFLSSTAPRHYCAKHAP